MALSGLESKLLVDVFIELLVELVSNILLRVGEDVEAVLAGHEPLKTSLDLIRVDLHRGLVLDSEARVVQAQRSVARLNGELLLLDRVRQDNTMLLARGVRDDDRDAAGRLGLLERLHRVRTEQTDAT